MEKTTSEILWLSSRQVVALKSQILGIYREAFALPPYSRTELDVDSFSRTLDRHLERRGFRCVVALEGSTERLAGFSYGYSSAPGQWWHDLVEGKLDPGTADRWLSDTFELAELAVAPQAQGQGLGSRLHDILLAGLTHRTAVLSTIQSETVALKLYRKRGWTVLLEDFFFPGTSKPYIIMGLKLKP
jgi:ribosomal protein S18 acetylase RimI-like enzyme